ncbi:hypothetical protein [Halomarina litorea]|uniref:hypothetical protein n=1 Tax=Halomarina litorea TaxID=2961595 RepID=UPI0020C572B3|nr:hypothetical protein [Halomarina sp. BCD28]
MATTTPHPDGTEVRTFDPRLDAGTATERTDRITTGAYLRSRVASLFGRDERPADVSLVYYPDYVAYTTVTLHRYVGGDRTVKFLVGIDAVTGRVGEVDVDLPTREARRVDPSAVIAPDRSPVDAEAEWEEWLFPYLDRRFRPVKRPDYTLDDLELVFVPYWLVDYGSAEESYVVSGLTKQVEEVVSLKPVEGYYAETRGAGARE